MNDKDLPRLALSAVIILYFGYALIAHWSEGLEETLKNIVMLAVGYWLGSSKGSSDKASQIEQQMSGTQEVKVVNPKTNPVQTEESKK